MVELGGTARNWEELGGIGWIWVELGGTGRKPGLGGTGWIWVELGGIRVELGETWVKLRGTG